MKKNITVKDDKKMTKEELEMWLHFRKKCAPHKKKKGKGSYTRKNKKIDF